MNIKELRDNIDCIDKQIIELLEKRFIVCKDIGNQKVIVNRNIDDNNRENYIINNIRSQSYEYSDSIVEIYKAIFNQSKIVQKNNSHLINK